MPTRRSILAAGVLLAPLAAKAQTWPSGIIKIVTPFAAGGPSDGIARIIQPGLQQRLGVTVIIENKPGASATLGAAAVAKSPPDGNTWLFTSDTFVVSPLLMTNPPFDVKQDFEPVTLVGRAPEVLCAHHARPYRSLGDLIADAKAKPETISYGTSGTGGIAHLTTVLLSQRTGMRLVHVPYRGMGPAVNDAVAGHVDLIMGSTSALGQQIEARKLRPLVQCGGKRAASLPDVPTMIESGYAGFEAYVWFGMFAPARTPAAIVDQFYRDLAAAAREDATARQLVRAYQMDLPLLTPPELRALLDEQIRLWGAVIRDNNIKADM